MWRKGNAKPKAWKLSLTPRRISELPSVWHRTPGLRPSYSSQPVQFNVLQGVLDWLSEAQAGAKEQSKKVGDAQALQEDRVPMACVACATAHPFMRDLSTGLQAGC